MRGTDHTDRGQAITLEAVIGGLVVLAAFLFALQSVVVTPTTSSAVDPDTRADLRTQAEDILTLMQVEVEGVSLPGGGGGIDRTNLSYRVRYWNENRGTFAGPNATSDTVGYGSDSPPGGFGTLLNETFTQHSHSYNVEILYQHENRSTERGRLVMVHQGTPGEGAVVATRTVVLHDNDTLTAPGTGETELWEYDTNATNNDDGYYPIPDAVDGSVYNVVEVRVTVW